MRLFYHLLSVSKFSKQIYDKNTCLISTVSLENWIKNNFSNC